MTMRLTSLAPSASRSSSAAYDPSLPRKSTGASRATPFAVRHYLEALDDALEWLCTAASASLSNSSIDGSQPLASKVVAISIASAVSRGQCEDIDAPLPILSDRLLASLSRSRTCAS